MRLVIWALGKNRLKEPCDALRRKLSRLLFLGRDLDGGAIGAAWDQSDEDHSRHVGLVYKKRIVNIETAEALRKKEFRSRRAPWLVSTLIKPADLLSSDETHLEPWSKAILEHSDEWD